MRRVRSGLVAALLLVGCSSVPEGAIGAQALACPPGEPGCDEIRPVGPGGDLELDAGEFFFEIAGGTTITGDVLVTLTNIGTAEHNAEFLGAADGSEIVWAQPGQSETGTVLLFPGEWTVICNISGHRAAGMETTIVVYATEEEAEAAANVEAEPGV